MYDINSRMDAWTKAGYDGTGQETEKLQRDDDGVGGNMQNGSISKPDTGDVVGAGPSYKRNPYDINARTAAWNQAGLSSEKTEEILRATSPITALKRSADLQSIVDSMGEEELAAKMAEALDELERRMSV